VVITGMAYGRRATLDIAGDTLTWRAHRGFPPVAENIVTTIHEIRFAELTVERASWLGVAIATCGGLVLATDSIIVGICGLAIGGALIGRRALLPRQQLVLDLGANRLVLAVDPQHASAARKLAGRIATVRATGELPASPPTLP
jgi:hypothetical protein